MVLQKGSINIEDSSLGFSVKGLRSVMSLSFSQLKIYSSLSLSPSLLTMSANVCNPYSVLGHTVCKSLLQRLQSFSLPTNSTSYILFQVQIQNILQFLILQTRRLKGLQACASTRILFNYSLIFSSTYSQSLTCSSGIKEVFNNFLKTFPRDLPCLLQVKSQLVRIAIMPVLILNPSQVPLVGTSLPAQIYWSSSKGPKGRVGLQDCQSLLNPIMSWMFLSDVGLRQKNVTHIAKLLIVRVRVIMTIIKSISRHTASCMFSKGMAFRCAQFTIYIWIVRKEYEAQKLQECGPWRGKRRAKSLIERKKLNFTVIVFGRLIFFNYWCGILEIAIFMQMPKNLETKIARKGNGREGYSDRLKNNRLFELFDYIRGLNEDKVCEANSSNSDDLSAKCKIVPDSIDFYRDDDESNSSFVSMPCTTTQKIFKKNFGLRKIVGAQKTKMLTNNFKTKLLRNLVSSPPVDFQPYKDEEQSHIHSFLNKEGFTMPYCLDLFYCFLTVITIFGFFFINSLAFIFPTLGHEPFFFFFQCFGVCLFTAQIGINLTVVKSLHGRKLIQIKHIISNYLRGKFIIDLLCALSLFVELTIHSNEFRVIKLIVFLKMVQLMDKISKIESCLIYSFARQQYLAMSKIILVNFGFAHVLAILLLAMSHLEAENNWLTKISIHHNPWYEQYAWAYYWGTTTMLTVGFGDISPANYKEALCLTIIEAFSCILLAYNINCVGSLISNISRQNQQRQKNLKTIRRLTQENNLSEELERKICNYINESDRMKKKFKFETDKTFVAALPSEIKNQFIKEYNKLTFNNLTFFKNLTERSLLALAQKIDMKIAHPEEIIFRASNQSKFLILKDGVVGYCTKLAGSKYSQSVVNQLKIQKGENPQLLHLLFLSLQANPKYEIKSLGYSMIAEIDIQEAKEILRNSAYDFENFCQSKDQSKHQLDQFETLQCEFCTTKHTKIKCPKLHYIPIKQMVIFKELQSIKTSKSQRKSFPRSVTRYPSKKFSSLKCRKLSKKLEKIIYGKFREEETVGRNKYNRCLTAFQTMPKCKSFHSEITPKFSEETQVSNFAYKIETQIASLIKKPNDESFFSSPLKLDQLHNYKFYFSASNGENLKELSLGRPYFYLEASEILESIDFHNQEKESLPLSLVATLMKDMMTEKEMRNMEDIFEEQMAQSKKLSNLRVLNKKPTVFRKN